MMPFESLKAWQASHRLALAVYKTTSAFPPHERYGLTSQMRRAAYSAAANIAEGSAKRGPREFRRYLDISLGSMAEIAYGIRLAADLGLIPAEQAGELETMRSEAGRLTWGLHRRLT